MLILLISEVVLQLWFQIKCVELVRPFNLLNYVIDHYPLVNLPPTVVRI